MFNSYACLKRTDRRFCQRVDTLRPNNGARFPFHRHPVDCTHPDGSLKVTHHQTDHLELFVSSSPSQTIEIRCRRPVLHHHPESPCQCKCHMILRSMCANHLASSQHRNNGTQEPHLQTEVTTVIFPGQHLKNATSVMLVTVLKLTSWDQASRFAQEGVV